MPGPTFWGMGAVAEQYLSDEAYPSVKSWHGAWTRVLGHLKEEVGEAAYRSWLQPTSLSRCDNGHAIVAAPTSFLRDWVATHYADRLLALWQAENRTVTRVSVVVAVLPGRNGIDNTNGSVGGREGPPPTDTPLLEPSFGVDIGEDKAQLSALDQRFTFENFIVGKPNELAHAAADVVSGNKIIRRDNCP